MPRNIQMLRTSVQPYEVLLQDFAVQIESQLPIHPEAAQNSITVEGRRGLVHLSGEGRTAEWRPLDKIPAGMYYLNVSGLYSDKNEKIPDQVRIPFFVAQSAAKVPGEYVVESFVRLRVNDLDTERLSPLDTPSGPYIDVFKATERRGGKTVELAFNERGERVEKEKIFDTIRRNRAEKFGKVHETLYHRLQKMSENESVEVAIWLNVQEPAVDKIKLSEEAYEQAPEEALRLQKRIQELMSAFAEKYLPQLGAEKFRIDGHAPAVYAMLTPAQIKRVAALPEVTGLFLYEREGIEDLEDSIAIASSDDVHTLGITGSGVKVAVWESGPDDTSDLVISGFYDLLQTNQSDHARHTHGIIKNKEKNKPRGHASACTLYSANNKDLDALKWAATDRGCTVISQSFHRSSEPGSSGLSYDDIYKDWLALHWPYPTMLQAAGNYWQGDPDNIQPPSSEYVNHKGYNSLAVGNHDDTASAMSGSSVFRNPSSAHGDRELPEICANGTSVTTVGLTKSGTSMAAPAAAGVTALMQQANSSLKSWPEGCRAILLAGATRNVTNSTWWADVISNVDAGDGAGAVNALESLHIAQSRRWKNAAATRRGWDVGLLTSSDFGADKNSTFTYKVQVPNQFMGPRKVKVALAWTSKVTDIDLPFIDPIPLSSQLVVDLDLRVYDSNNNLVGYSGSWDNSYEIAEFTGQPGQTYTIRIRRWSGTANTYYGLAWTVTGGLFIGDFLAGLNGLLRESMGSVSIGWPGGFRFG